MPGTLKAFKFADNFIELDGAGKLGLEEGLGVGVEHGGLGVDDRGGLVEDRGGIADQLDSETAGVGSDGQDSAPTSRGLSA